MQGKQGTSPTYRRAFTLVELLVVLGIFLVLLAVALPITKGLLVENKATRASQGIASFFEIARNRAIVQGRPFGVRIERLDDGGGTGSADADRSMALTVRHLTGTPPYSGDAADARVLLRSSGGPNSPVDRGIFSNRDSPLLLLSANLNRVADPGNPTEQELRNIDRAPIKIGDLIELPGGHLAPITGIESVTAPPESVRLDFDLSDAVRAADGSIVRSGGVNVVRFPGLFRSPTGTGDQVPYKIQRSPVASTNSVFEMPRGLAIDLNFSGIGLASNNFAPPTNPANQPAPAIDILFGSDGSVSQLIVGTQRIYPQSMIYLCVGRIDGVADVIGVNATDRENLFAADRIFTSNLLDEQTSWIVINPWTGRINTVGNATVSSVPSDPTNPAPTEAADQDRFRDALREARLLTTFSDSSEETL